jgi:hypothetical protein
VLQDTLDFRIPTLVTKQFCLPGDTSFCSSPYNDLFNPATAYELCFWFHNDALCDAGEVEARASLDNDVAVNAVLILGSGDGEVFFALGISDVRVHVAAVTIIAAGDRVPAATTVPTTAPAVRAAVGVPAVRVPAVTTAPATAAIPAISTVSVV